VAPTSERGAERVDLVGLEADLLEGGRVQFSDYRGSVLLLVNVASRCGYTPQYAGLQRLHERFSEQGLLVLGFPCNQFLFQERGDAGEIRDFCTRNYGVSFPLFAKLRVNGPRQHPIYRRLTRVADDSGRNGMVRWNFEKFLVDRSGAVRRRFRSNVEPEAPTLVGAVIDLLREDQSSFRPDAAGA